jgi:hypothetical protein
MWHEPNGPIAGKARKPVTSRTPRTPLAPEWTYSQALERFRHEFKDGFQDEQYAIRERDWKWAKHELWLETAGPEGFRALAAASPDKAAGLIEAMIQTTSPMLDPRAGTVPLRDAVRKPESAGAYFTALADLLEAPAVTSRLFDNHLQALTALSLARSGDLEKWTILTIIPFFAQPSRHMFLQPRRTKEIVKRLGKDIHYAATPKWDTYDRLLVFSNELLEFLKPQGAQDMIDVQSFIWAVTGSGESAAE